MKPVLMTELAGIVQIKSMEDAVRSHACKHSTIPICEKLNYFRFNIYTVYIYCIHIFITKYGRYSLPVC